MTGAAPVAAKPNTGNTRTNTYYVPKDMPLAAVAGHIPVYLPRHLQSAEAAHRGSARRVLITIIAEEFPE